MTPPLHILILAAGASSRMGGRDKLMEEVGGTPLIRRTVTEALATNLPVTVVLPPDRPLRHAALADLGARIVTADQAQDGMAHSLRAGLAALPADAAVMLLLSDLPQITRADLSSMATAQAAHPDHILRAHDAMGQAGHPVVFPPWCRADLMDLKGDEGARRVLASHAARLLPVPTTGNNATTDLDTPDDWARWRAIQSRP